MTEQTPLANRTIGDYLATLGSSAPAPGGGSVAGLVGALAAGLGQMVISLTVKNDHDPLLHDRFDALHNAIRDLLESAADDELAYSGYVDAGKMPKSTDEEKIARRSAMQAALVNAGEVPLRLAEQACGVLDCLEAVALHGTTHALSDADIAVSLAHAAVLAGLANIRINVPFIKDAAISQRLSERANELETVANERATNLRSTLAARRTSS
jgi:formiminotetrahydrofolate cyclodeaminase